MTNYPRRWSTTGPAIVKYQAGRQSRGSAWNPAVPPAQELRAAPRVFQKVVESPEEMRTPATEYTHARPRCRSPGNDGKLAASGTPAAAPPFQPAQRLTRRGDRSVHFCRHR